MSIDDFFMNKSVLPFSHEFSPKISLVLRRKNSLRREMNYDRNLSREVLALADVKEIRLAREVESEGTHHRNVGNDARS